MLQRASQRSAAEGGDYSRAWIVFPRPIWSARMPLIPFWYRPTIHREPSTCGETRAETRRRARRFGEWKGRHPHGWAGERGAGGCFPGGRQQVRRVDSGGFRVLKARLVVFQLGHQTRGEILPAALLRGLAAAGAGPAGGAGQPAAV